MGCLLTNFELETNIFIHFDRKKPKFGLIMTNSDCKNPNFVQILTLNPKCWQKIDFFLKIQKKNAQIIRILHNEYINWIELITN